MTEVTEVGMGTTGKQTLSDLFPQIDPAVRDRVCVEIAPDSARDAIGGIWNQATLIPVPPDRIPEPLSPELAMPLVISVQVFNATRFDVPAPVTFPNLPDPITGVTLEPGAKTGLWSYDHDAGRWTLQGSMTVSEDGLFLLSDPGTGIRAPGWHGANQGDPGEDGGTDNDRNNDRNNCTTQRRLYTSAGVQCAVGAATGLAELTPGVGCAVSLGGATAGAAVDCGIDPENCSTTIAKSALGGIAGCVPGVGLAVTGIICTTTVSSAWISLRNCESSSRSNGVGENGWEMQSDFQTREELDARTMFDDQIELIFKAQALYESVAGDPEWWAVPVAELPILKNFFSEFEETMSKVSADGVQINTAELTVLLNLDRPSNLTDDHVNALIARFNRFSSGGMTAEEQAAIVESSTAFKEKSEYLEAIGWETTYGKQKGSFFDS